MFRLSGIIITVAAALAMAAPSAVGSPSRDCSYVRHSGYAVSDCIVPTSSYLYITARSRTKASRFSWSLTCEPGRGAVYVPVMTGKQVYKVVIDKTHPRYFGFIQNEQGCHLTTWIRSKKLGRPPLYVDYGKISRR